MLRRDLSDLALKPGTEDCVVLSGILKTPTRQPLINFLRGSSTSSAVQIDHVVALSDAWQKGAQQLTGPSGSFANDPLNLLAVDGPANQQKSDGDAATWLPPNKSYRCDYVARADLGQGQLRAVGHPGRARRHGPGPGRLPEHRRPHQPSVTGLPGSTGQRSTRPGGPCSGPAAPAPAPATVYYANCAAARAAGAAPLRAGQPGYRAKMDGDRDGVACE